MPISKACDSINHNALCGGIKGLKQKQKSLMQGKSIDTKTGLRLQQWPADLA